jgi:hypothetical protein
MTARGVVFLKTWIAKNVAGEPADVANAGLLAAKLLANAAVAGFTLADMGLEEDTVEDYIREAMVYLNAPGTPGD